MPNCYYYDEQRNRCKCYINENLDELLAENAKLRRELGQWERLTANIELPDYPITEFVPKDLERENAKLRERVDELEGLTDGKRYIPQEWYQLATNENAKLRELVSRAWGLFLKHGAVHPCDLLEVDAVRDEMRELEIEVDR